MCLALTAIFCAVTSYAQPTPSSTGQVAEVPNDYDAGINYISDTEVALVLRAPNLQSAAVIGDFNDWSAWDMNNSSDGEWWWIEISGLEAGKEYGYQYLTDTYVKSADPFADKILDQWQDKWIDDDRYPDLLKFPEEGDTYVSVFQTAQQPYEWKVTDFNRPDQSQLNIYELLVRDFTKEQTFQAVIDRLDYLQLLGVNAVELMPIQEFDGNNSWGYNPNFYFAVDKWYGTKNDFKRLVDECHMRGMAVIMDVVYNFTWNSKSPYINMYIDQDIQSKPLKDDNPMYNVDDPNPVYSWGTDINHESDFTQWFVNKAIAYWVEEYNVDGYRFDFAKGFTNTPGEQGGADAARKAILKSYADNVWAIDPDVYMILEYFVDGGEEWEMANYTTGPNGGNGFMPWVNMHDAHSESMMGWTNAEKINHEWADYKKRNWNGNGVVYFQSHDEERQMWRNYQYGNSWAKDTAGALKRSAQLAAYFFTLPGSKMIYQFDELGYDYCINYDDYWGDENCGEGETGRTSPKPVRWDYYEDADRKATHDVYAKIMRLRRRHPFMHSDDYTADITGRHKFIKINSDTNVVFVSNFAVTTTTPTTTIDPLFAHTGTWYEYFTGESIEVTDQNMTFELEGGEFRLYTDYPVDDLVVNPCESSISTSIGSDTLICEGTSITLTAPAGFETYMWDGAEGTSSFEVDAPGLYTFKGVDSDGCFGIDEIEIRQTLDCGSLDCSGAGEIDLGADTVICEKTTIKLDLGTSYDNVRWNGEYGDESYTVRTPGTYTVLAEDTAGCIVEGDLLVEERSDCSDLLVNDEFYVRLNLNLMNKTLDCDLSENDDLYLHMGVCIDNATDCADPANLWKHVVGNWGQDDGIGLMTKINTDPPVYQLDVDPDTYFTDSDNLSDPFDLGSTVYSLSMVIRNADGSKQCPGGGTGDLFAFNMDENPSTVKRIKNSAELGLDSVIVINGEVGINEQKNVQNAIRSVFPNPSTGQVYIQAQWNPGQTAHLTVRNSLGQIVHTEQFTPMHASQVKTVNLGEVATNAGLYFIEIQQEDQRSGTSILLKK